MRSMSQASRTQGTRIIRPTHPMHPDFVEPGPGRLLGSYLTGLAATRPGDLALVDAEHRLSWADLEQRAQASARQLVAHGLRAHDVALVMLPNWWEAAVAMHGFLKVGAVTNPVVPIYRDAELSFILRQARPRALVIPHRFRGFDYVEMFERLLPQLDDPPAVLVVRPEGPLPPGFGVFDASGDGAEVENPTSADDVCMLMYTSGTTSDPKGVLHDHRTLERAVRGMSGHSALDPDETIFMPSPVTHITGFTWVVLAPVLVGTPCVLMDVWDPARAREIIEAEQCRFSIGATPFLQGLLDAYRAAGTGECALHGFICGGADVPADLIRAARRELGMWAGRCYGSSEVPAYVIGGRDQSEHICAETDGIPMLPGSEARLHEAVDGVGELLLRGPQMFLGYLDPALNADSFTADGFFHSGDLGEIGPDGEVTIRGRKKDIILRGGENVSAKQVEDALYRHPKVGAVAVVAMPDPVLVERGCAFVVPAGSPPSLAELTAFLGEQGLAKQKWPERLEIVDELPATASGKVQKFRLREQIRELLAREAAL